MNRRTRLAALKVVLVAALLGALYFALILLNWLLLVPLAILTMLDLAFRMRARTTGKSE